MVLSPQNSQVTNDMSNRVFLRGILQEELPNLEEVSIKNNEELTCLWRAGHGLLQDIGSLHQLKIASCPQLVSLVEEEEKGQQQQGLPCRLQVLELSSCPRLVKLPQAFLSFSSLRDLKISDCDSMEALPDALMHKGKAPLEKLIISGCHTLSYIARAQLPPSLKKLRVYYCNSLRTLVDEDQILDINSCGGYTSVLEQLQIIHCPSLTSLWSKSELPATLENIYVDRCSKLAFLSLRGNLSKSLKHLYIVSCSNLESIAEGLDDNTSLETMEIFICQNLKVLPDNLHKARHLRLLRINECPNLVSFPEGGLAPFSKLTMLEIFNCEKLKALPNGLRNLTSLQYLLIQDCPSIGSFTANCFPTNLTSVRIDYEKIYKPLILERGPGLHRFTSLRQLTLFGGECCSVVSFPLEKDTGKALPASLKHLSIWNFPNLERISSIENLTSFESLQLCCCPKLQEFPDNGLPISLLRLEIYGCPLIEERFEKDKGQYWSLIADIPCVRIDCHYV